MHIFEEYRDALTIIREEGLLTFLRRISTPYLARAARHFRPAEPTYTERWLVQQPALGRSARGVAQWLSWSKPAAL